MLKLLAILVSLALLVICAPSRAQAQTCSFAVSDVAFGSVTTVGGPATVDTTGTLSISCSRLNLLGAPQPATITVCPNLDAGSAGSSGSRRLIAGPSGATLSYQLYQDAARTKGWGSAAFLQFGATPTLTFTSDTQGNINTSTPIFGRLTPQGSAVAGAYSSTFSGENFFWGVNILTCAGVTVGTAAPPPAFHVTATVPLSCLMSVSPLSFGARGLLNTATTATSALSVACTANAPYTVALGAGLNSAGPTQRRLIAGGQTIAYGLYQDAGLTQPWGATGSTLLSRVGSGAPGVITIYGQVPAQATPTPGTYTDTVVVTLTY